MLMKMVMRKKAVSNVVSAVLIILIVVSAIAILSFFIIRFSYQQRDIINGNMKLSEVGYKINHASIINGSILTVNISISQDRGNVNIENVTTTTSVYQSPVDIVNVIDLSGSMIWNLSKANPYQVGGMCGIGNCPGINRNCDDPQLYNESTQRLSIAKCITDNFMSDIINSNTKSRIGISAFATTVLANQSLSLTNNLNNLKNVVNNFTIGDTTCICCGIDYAANMLIQNSTTSTPKVMILMSDGTPSSADCNGVSDSPAVTIAAACNANSNINNLTIYAIGFGLDANSDVLQQVANCGGGEYYNATNVTNFISAYEQITKTIKRTYQTASPISYMVFVFTDANGNTYTQKVSDLPSSLFSSMSYTFNLQGHISNVKEVDIYPVITLSSGSDLAGQVQDTWVFN